MSSSEKKEQFLFAQGIIEFNRKKFYDAHEYWEELWLDYKIKDALFIQGLIQLSVSYFHYFNGNINGSRSMIKKSLKKFDAYNFERGIDVVDLRNKMLKIQKKINEIDVTSINIDDYIFKIKVKHE